MLEHCCKDTTFFFMLREKITQNFTSTKTEKKIQCTIAIYSIITVRQTTNQFCNTFINNILRYREHGQAPFEIKTMAVR